MKNKRINWIDTAKGWGIIFVIIGHYDKGNINTILYSFHIPLFFIISGYLFKYTNNMKKFLINKFKKLIIPYFILGIIIILYKCLSTKNFNNFFKYFIDIIIQKRTFTVWFLTCLFCLNIFFYIIFKLCKTKAKIGITCLLLTTLCYLYIKSNGQVLIWNIDASIMALPFFFVGYILKEKTKIINSFLNNKKRIFFSFVIFVILNFLFLMTNIKLGYNNLEMHSNNYGLLPLTYSSAIFGSLAVLCFSKLIDIYIVKYIGKNSLVYFALHQDIFMPITSKIMIYFNIFFSNKFHFFTKLFLQFFTITILLFSITICNLLINKIISFIKNHILNIKRTS